jgi:hypothetical protein
MPLETLADLAERMEQDAQRIRELVAAFGDDIACERVPSDEFSATEHICHLRDLERRGFHPRIADMLTKEMPQLYDFDGAAVARASNYMSEDPQEALDAFLRARAENVQVIRRAPANAAQRLGFYKAGSAITLASVLNGVVEHDADHIARLEALKDACA